MAGTRSLLGRTQHSSSNVSSYSSFDPSLQHNQALVSTLYRWAKQSTFDVVVNMGATEGEDVLQIRMMTSSSLRVLSKELSLRREEPGKLGYDWYRGMDASKCRQKSAIHWIRGFKDCIIPEQQNKSLMKEKHSHMFVLHLYFIIIQYIKWSNMFYWFRISIFKYFFLLQLYIISIQIISNTWNAYICRVGKGRVDEQYRGKCLLSNMNKQYCKMTVSILPSPALSLRFVSTWYSSLSRLNKTLSRSPSVDLTQTALSFSPGLWNKGYTSIHVGISEY